ncbi:Ig-like domain-containing protein, partial [Vibrio sp. Of7-15]|uniref:Ig-like domain-containing protein n=1 Tax=Vibrio sp. Of7-15 TaxID=2724879 RepID=UPI001EF2885F
MLTEKFKRIFLVFFFLSFVASCNSGGEGGSSAPSERKQGTISGVVFDAAISNALVRVYEFKDGKVGKLLGSTNSKPDGSYSINVISGPMPLYVVAEGGAYNDPYTNEKVTAGTVGPLRLISYVNYKEGENRKLMLTPLSNMAAGLSEYHIQWKGKNPVSAIDDSYAEIDALYGFDVTRIAPIDLKIDGKSSVATLGHEYGALLMAYSSYAYEQSQLYPSASSDEETVKHYTSYNLADIQYRDIKANGLLNGHELDTIDNTLKEISFGKAKVTEAVYTNNLSQHILRVVNDKNINQTGTPASDYQEQANKLNASDSELFPPREEIPPIDKNAPTVVRQGSEVLAATDTVTLTVSDYIGVAEVSVALQYKAEGVDWTEVAVCKPGDVNSYCSAQNSEIDVGKLEISYPVSVNTLLLDREFSATEARLSVYTKDTLGNDNGTALQNIVFEWDNEAPVITFDAIASPKTFNPNNSSVYTLKGTIKDVQTGIKSHTLEYTSSAAKELECHLISDPSGSATTCEFSEEILSKVFIDNKGVTVFTVTAIDNNGNETKATHQVDSDTTPPEQSISFPPNNMSFTIDGTESAERYISSSFSDLDADKYLNVNYAYAKDGLKGVHEHIDFKNFTPAVLDTNLIPYIRVTVKDGDAINSAISTSAEKLTLFVRYEATEKGSSNPSITNTISSNAIDSFIPHETVNFTDGRASHVVYYIPFTKEILGEEYRDITEEYTQKLTIWTKDESGNPTEVPYETSFKSSFNLPAITVTTPFIDAKATFYIFDHAGRLQQIESCTTKQTASTTKPETLAKDVASCSYNSQYVGQVLKVVLSSTEGTHYYQWEDSNERRTSVDLGPEQAIAGYFYVEDDKKIYLTELSVYQSGFFDWYVEQQGGEKTPSMLKATLDDVNALFKGTQDVFFGFNPVETAYATNDDLKGTIPSPPDNKYQHRFLVESINKMAGKHELLNSVHFAKAFYDDFSFDGKPNGTGANGSIILDTYELSPETYRSDLAEYYFELLTEDSRFSSVSPSIAMAYANLISKANPTLGEDKLFDKPGESIDKKAPDVSSLVEGSNYYFDGKNHFIRDLIHFQVDVTDPSGFDDRLPLMELFWSDAIDKDGDQVGRVADLVTQDITAYHKKYDFDFYSAEYVDKNIQRVDLAVSASDAHGNSWGFDKEKHYTTYLVDNEPPFYEYFPPLPAELPPETYLNLNSSHRLTFKITDVVGENTDKRKLVFKQNGLQDVALTKEDFVRDVNGTAELILCNKATCGDMEDPYQELADGQWKLYVEAEDILGNKISISDSKAQKFDINVDSSAPPFTSPEVVPVFGGNYLWPVSAAVSNGKHSIIDDVKIKIVTPRGTYQVCHQELTDECNTDAAPAYLIDNKVNTKVQLISGELEADVEYRFDIEVLNSAYPQQMSAGQYKFKVDNKGPKIETPTIVGGKSLVGRSFALNVSNITDQSDVESVKVLWLKPNSDPVDIFSMSAPENTENLTILLKEEHTDKIEFVDDNINTELAIQATDEHDFVGRSNSVTVKLDKEGPSLSLDGFDKNAFYEKGYDFTLIASDLVEDSSKPPSEGVDKSSLRYWTYVDSRDPNDAGQAPKGDNNNLLETHSDSNFKIEVYAKDVRNNPNTEIFDVKVDVKEPNAELIVSYENGAPLSDNNTVTLPHNIKLVLKASDEVSGVDPNSIKGTITLKGSNTPIEIRNFINNQDGTWYTILGSEYIQTDGTYTVSVSVSDNTKRQNEALGLTTTRPLTLYVQRNGYYLDVLTPEDFPNHVSGKDLKVEFKVSNENVSARMSRLECWLADGFTGDGVPPDDLENSYKVTIENPQDDPYSCSFMDIPHNLLQSPALVTRTTIENNGAEVVQRRHLHKVDVTPPTIENKDAFLLTPKNVFYEKGDNGSRTKKLMLAIKLVDKETKIDIKDEKLLRLVNKNQQKFEKQSSNGDIYNFAEDYYDLIDRTAQTNTLRLEGVTDQAGNQITQENEVITLNKPKADIPVKILEPDSSFIKGDEIKFGFTVTWPQNSSIHDITVTVAGVDYTQSTDDNNKPKFVNNGTSCLEDPASAVSQSDGSRTECWAFSSSLNLPDNTRTVKIALNAMDIWDNRNTQEETLTLNVDAKEPDIGDTYTLSRDGDNLKTTFSINDNDSGLAKITYVVTGLGEPIKFEWESPGNSPYNQIDIPMSRLSSANSFTVDIRASDNVGNEAESQTPITVDITRPVITADFDGVTSDTTNGFVLFTKSDQAFRLTTERNTKGSVWAESYRLLLEHKDNAALNVEISGDFNEQGTIAENVFNTNSQPVTEYEYQLKLIVTDSIGREIPEFKFGSKNVTDRGLKALFDYNKPVINGVSIEQPTMVPDNGGYYPVTVKATITDPNLDDNKIAAVLKKAGDTFTSKTVARPGGEFEFNFVVPPANDYTLEIKAQDLAEQEEVHTEINVEIKAADVPTLTITRADDPADSPIGGDQTTKLTFKFSEDVQNFDQTDVQCKFADSSNSCGVITDWDEVSAQQWTATYTSPVDKDGTETITVSGDSYQSLNTIPGAADSTLDIPVVGTKPVVANVTFDPTFGDQGTVATVKVKFDGNGADRAVKGVVATLGGAAVTWNNDPSLAAIEWEGTVTVPATVADHQTLPLVVAADFTDIYGNKGAEDSTHGLPLTPTLSLDKVSGDDVVNGIEKSAVVISGGST